MGWVKTDFGTIDAFATVIGLTVVKGFAIGVSLFTSVVIIYLGLGANFNSLITFSFCIVVF